MPWGTSSVSPLITRTDSTGRPEPVGDDHRERRLVPLPVRERARAEDRPAVRRDLDVAELRLDEAVRDLDVHADADARARAVALLAAPPLLVAQRLVAGGVEREVERPLVVARSRSRAPDAVVTGNASAGMRLRRRTSAGSSPISAANRSIARSIACVASGRPAPRNGPIGVVLVTTLTVLGLDLRDRVHAARHQRREAREDRAEARVRARVLRRRRSRYAWTSPSRLPPIVNSSTRRATVRHRDHVLAARLRPADRTPGLAREPGDEDRPRRSRPFAPKPPPTSGATTRTSLGLEAEDQPRGPWRSWCGVCVESHSVSRPSSPTAATHAARLERAGRQPLAHETARDDDVAAVEQRLVGLSTGWLAQTFVPSSGKSSTSSCERLLRVDDDGQRVVVDDRRARRRRRRRRDSR